MSGLEVFALVASIFQVISFAGQTIELCKTVYDGGLPDKRLGDKAAAMYDLSIKVLYQCQATPGAQSDPERELTAFATKCREMARELKESVDRFDRPQAKGKLLPSMVTTFGYQLQKRSLKRLEKDLESHRQMLETKLLARVCSRAQATEILLWENFHTLDERVRHFVKRYADGHTRLQDLIMEESLRLERALSAHVTKETSNSTQSILAEMRKGLEDLSARMPGTAEEEAPRRKRFLESVKYSRMDARQNQVRESHSGTFSWMLAGRDLSSQEWEAGIQDSSRAKLFGTKDNKTKRKDLLDEDPYFSRDDVRREKRWDDFRDWLKSASNLYWISGKPGSGKSTLVKFLVESPFTQEALDISKPATRIISHFFWKPGTEMQNSRKGLLCSLLYQLISSDPALLPPLLERNPSLESNTYYTDWSVEDLSSACFAAFELHPSAVCVFIDGLDEAREADIPDVLRTVDRMSTTPKVKVCVSSRPEQRFLQLVQSNKGLRLEDLTLGDMRRYARHHLNPFLKSSSVFSNTQHSIPEELARKAQGVFLWLYLATQCLVRGLDNRDHQEEELAKRLSVLPTELEDLYNDMWLRLNEDGETDRQSTALFFNLILDARALGQRVPGRGDDWGDSREIRRGSKDYEPLTVPITDYLAEIDCGYCFVDKEYQRVVKREDGSMVRVVPEDWDKEAREAQGELVPSLWFGVVLRIFEMLLWVSAWFWRLGVPSTKRKRLGGQEVS
ncbi:hypothetical protein C8A05DRAFT_30256 [Staphylotrichum tortipilum]|uniref:NACHT domain-containing protein n=1 Tax=Staphylotrichum tortipilum TaxID=2831512 RepID=A0AAN6RWD2_9PEZI|nr:hypothetical protein C8A05DRAFT_30256 [Staphylotrichum longicolle]